MTRDEIYDHLAQVYLGKRSKGKREDRNKEKKEFNAWLVINIVITLVIFTSAFYGLTAFLAHRGESIQSNIHYALNNGPIRVKYDLNEPYPAIKTFSLPVPKVNVGKYSKLNFSIRGLDEGYPGVVKVVLKNRKKEISAYFVKDVKLNWQECSLSFDEFPEITDWTNLTEVSFVFEAWNVEKKKGVVLIDDVSFSG